MKIHIERPAASELKHYADLKRISLRCWLIKFVSAIDSMQENESACACLQAG